MFECMMARLVVEEWGFLTSMRLHIGGEQPS